MNIDRLKDPLAAHTGDVRGAQEARQLARCHRARVRTPCVFAVDLQRNTIVMEWIAGPTVKEWLRARPLGDASPPAVTTPHAEMAAIIGRNLARLHDHQIVHGDLTTSNMIVVDADTEATDVVRVLAFGGSRSRGGHGTLTAPGLPPHGNVRRTFLQALIDFGLSYTSTLAEDMAVDLYVLERAFLSTHPNTSAMVRRSNVAAVSGNHDPCDWHTHTRARADKAMHDRPYPPPPFRCRRSSPCCWPPMKPMQRSLQPGGRSCPGSTTVRMGCRHAVGRRVGG